MSKRLTLLSLAAATLIAGCGGDKEFKPNAIISGVTPNQAASGRDARVEIHGDFTKWSDTKLSATDISFGAGITVEALTVANEGFLLVDISLADDAALGPRDIDVDGELAVGAFAVTAPFEIIETAFAGGYSYLTIVGNGTDWADGVTQVSIEADDVVSFGTDVIAPNLIRTLIVTDLFAPAGGRDVSINGITLQDVFPGALAIDTVTPTVLNSSENAAGTISGNDLLVYRIPAGDVGDEISMSFPDSDGDLEVRVFSQDDGLDPIEFIETPDFFESPTGAFVSLAFGNADKDYYVTVQDYYLEPDEIAWEYDFVRIDHAPELLAPSIMGEEIPAAGAENWYRYQATKWNISQVAVVPTATVSTIDVAFTYARDGGHDFVFVDSNQLPGINETAVFLNGSRPNGLLYVEDTTGSSGPDTAYTVQWSEAPVTGDHFEAATGNVAIPDDDGASSLVSTLTVPADPTGGAGITALHVMIDIGHPWVGDLVIELTAPDQTASIFLWDTEGGGSDGILHSFGSMPGDTFMMDFTDFEGLDPTGVWTLEITDTFSPDSGTLNAWAISIE